MFRLAHADLLCLLFGAALLWRANSNPCTEESCEENNVTLLQKKLQLDVPQTSPSLVQDGSFGRSHSHLAACARQASSVSTSAMFAGKGTEDAVGEALECVVQGTRIHRDSGEAAVGAFRIMDAAVAKALAAEPPNTLAAMLCLFMVGHNVVFNRELTLVMNRSTHTMEHIIHILKLHPDDALINFALLQMIAGDASYVCPELTPFVTRLGGFDVLFAALENFKDKPHVMMSAWRGLSDHSHSAFGADIIANHGGPMKGIHFVVEQLRTHPKPYLAESPLDHLSLKYEIMQIVNGMLEHDTDNTYGAAFIAEGLPEQMVYAMRAEPDLRGTQEVACQCMQRLLMRDPTAAQALEEAGAVEVLVAAIGRFYNQVDNTAWCGTTLGANYPVVPTCSSVLLKLVQTQPAAAEGLLGVLNDMQPGASVEPLEELLKQRPGGGFR